MKLWSCKALYSSDACLSQVRVYGSIDCTPERTLWWESQLQCLLWCVAMALKSQGVVQMCLVLCGVAWYGLE